MKYYFILIVSGLSHLSVLQASEWRMDASFDQEFSYDDNVRMLENDDKNKKGSFVYLLKPVLNARYLDLNSEITTSVSYGIQRYGTKSLKYDQDIQDYRLNAKHRTEETDYQFFSQYRQAPVRNSADTDSGSEFDSNADKTDWSIGGGIAHQVTYQDTLNVDFNYKESLYSEDDAMNSQFSDNKNIILDVSWIRQWSERYSSGVNFNYYHYESDPNSSSSSKLSEVESDSYGINFLNSYRLTEKWQALIQVGYRYTDIDIKVKSTCGESDPPPCDESDGSPHGFLTDSSLKYQGEVTTASINIYQSLQPSGRGQLNQQFGVNFSYRYKVTKRLSGAFATSYSEIQAISGQAAQNDRKNVTAKPSISYKLTPDWTVTGSYRYRFQDKEGNNSASKNRIAHSNTVMLTLAYDWQGLSLSR